MITYNIQNRITKLGALPWMALLGRKKADISGTNVVGFGCGNIFL